MAFRTIEISKPAELHVEKHQLVVMQDEGTVRIPLDDILHITCIGPNIRISTLALSKLNGHGITVMTIDEKYHASGISVPVEGNSRQSMVIHKQIELMGSLKERMLWRDIIEAKIKNQREVLRLVGAKGSQELDHILERLNLENIDECESVAAKKYFQALSPGLSRREECPINSKLNYGYAVLRNSIIRSLINKGFQPAIGIHHSNQLNAFNLADDIIEPFRPMVDLMAFYTECYDVELSKEERKAMANVLHSYCELNGKKEKLIVAIDHVIECLKENICHDAAGKSCEKEIYLPKVLPLEVSAKVEE